MKIVAISGSIVGMTTKTAMEEIVRLFEEKYPDHQTTLLDLASYQVAFSDGRNYMEYEGDTKEIATQIMNADAIVIGTPVFQSSIPGTLKNIFDLLPINAFRDKVVSIVVTAGSAKHYLVAEQQLKPILSYMKAHIVPTYVYIEEQDVLRKEIVNDDIHFRMERLVEDTVMTADVFAAVRKQKETEYDF